MVFNTKVFNDAKFGLCFNTAGDVSYNLILFSLCRFLKLYLTVCDLFSKLRWFKRDAPDLRHGAKQLKLRSGRMARGGHCFPKVLSGTCQGRSSMRVLWVATANVFFLWMVSLVLRFYVWRGATVGSVLPPCGPPPKRFVWTVV
jgi:hypothetical protein